MATDGDTDYKNFTHGELLEASSRVDKGRFPLNFAAINYEIEARKGGAGAAEHTAAEFERIKYANFWRRSGAGFLDSLILKAFFLLQALLLASIASISIQIGVFLFCSTIGVVYVIAMHARFGQTPGKMATGVVVVDLSERPITLKQALLREAFTMVVVLAMMAWGIPRIIHGEDPLPQPGESSVFILGLGFVAIAWAIIIILSGLTTKKQRAIHDFIAGTVVVRKTSLNRQLKA